MKKEYDFSKARRGPVVKTPGKTRITIYLDDDVLDAFRKRADTSGRGYQTMINEALRAALGQNPQGIDVRMIRRIIREETAAYGLARVGSRDQKGARINRRRSARSRSR